MYLHTITSEQTGFHSLARPPERHSSDPKELTKVGCQAGHPEAHTLPKASPVAHGPLQIPPPSKTTVLSPKS